MSENFNTPDFGINTKNDRGAVGKMLRFIHRGRGEQPFPNAVGKKKEPEKNSEIVDRQKQLVFLSLSTFVSDARKRELQDANDALKEMIPGSLVQTLQEKKLSTLLQLAEIERTQAKEFFSGSSSQERVIGENNNEDQASILSNEMFLVADGMGGVDGGGKAAAEHVIAFTKEYSKQKNWIKQINPTDAEAQMKELYTALIESFDQLHKAGKLVGASTLTLCRVVEHEGKEHLVILHVGDSPLYEYSDEKGLVKIETEKEENSYLWNLMSKEQRENGIYSLIKKMIDECKGDLLTHPITKEKVFDFDMPEYDRVPPGYKTRRFIKKHRSTVSDGITRPTRDGFAYKPDILSRPIPNKYLKYFAFTDGITNNLSEDDLKIAVTDSIKKNRMNGGKVIKNIISEVNDQVRQIQEVDKSRNVPASESLAKIDDETGLLFDMASTLSDDELVIFEMFSEPASVHSIEDFSLRLEVLGDVVISTVYTASGQEVKVKAIDVLSSVKKFSRSLDEKESEGYKHFYQHLTEKGWKIGDSKEMLIDIIGRYINAEIKNFPSGFKIRATAARLFADKYINTLKK